MNEENRTFINNPEAETLRGQTMYIHLPEGAVIVDRSQISVQAPVAAPLMSESTPPQVIYGQPVPQQSTPFQPGVQFAQPQAQPGVAYVQGQPQPGYAIPQQPQPEFANPQPQPGVTYIQGQPGVAYIQGQPGVAYAQPQPGVVYMQGAPSRGYGRRTRHDQIVFRRKHRLDWVHSMTVIFASYVILVTVVPFILSGIFGIGFYASKTESAELTIARGELLISHLTPVARVIPGDLVMLRDMNTWNLQVRQIGSINTTGLVTTISVNTGLNATSSEVLTMDSNTPVRNVTSAIPIFGYFVTFFSSALGKVLGAAIILYLNYRHLIRKRRARIMDEKLAYVVTQPTI